MKIKDFKQLTRAEQSKIIDKVREGAGLEPLESMDVFDSYYPAFIDYCTCESTLFFEEFEKI